MRRFRITEIVLSALAVLMIATASYLLVNDISVARLLNLHFAPGDPFEASYQMAATPTPAPSATPVSDQQNTTASVAGNSGASLPADAAASEEKPAVFLISPLNQAVIHPSDREDLAILQFEVYPKTAKSTLIITYQGQVAVESELRESATTLRVVQVPLKLTGLFEWRVKVNDITSELRTFTFNRIRPKK